ncbi:MAG: protein kinase [Candidatus Obscuribacterales bacterium]
MEQLKPETIIDEKYRVINTLGVGGMGIVYRVEQLSLNSERALKTIHTDKLSEAVWQRFQREAKAACRLDHSNLVKVFDYGLLEKVTPYYVMEIVQGQTLSARIKLLGTLNLEQCLNVFIPTAFALAYAHEKKIIHRDMKPANIMFSETNGKISEVKILDFGIAKLISDENLTNALTKPGEVIGSPHFMSPEQSWGGKVDARSDIYSLGCSMFEALTGLPPFIAKNAVQVIMLHQNSPPPTLAQVAPNLEFSESIEQVIRVMLAKDPDHRYQSMDELAQDLIAVKNGKQPRFAQAQDKQSEQDSNLPASKTIATKSIPSEEIFDDDEDISSDTIDKISESQTITTNILSRVNVPALALTIILIIAATATLIVLKPGQLHKTSRQTTATQPTAHDLPADPNKPFAHSAKHASGQKVTVFEFPKEFSAGEIRSLDGRHKLEARGEVTIPFGALIGFRPSKEFLEKPELFRKFGANEIAELDVSDRHMFNDTHVANMKHLVSIRYLNLKDTNLSSKCINDLNCLTQLRELNATNTGIDDKALARLCRLKNLEFLEAREFPSITETVKALAGSTKLRKLSLSNTCAENKLLKDVAQCRHLNYLSLSINRKITAEGVKLLIPLTQLNHLNLLDCRVGPEATAALASFKKMRLLKVNISNWSKGDVANLKQLLPVKCTLEVDETEPRQSREVLDQLNQWRSMEPVVGK